MPGLVLGLAACTLRGESDALAAARADSSAAGYAVGPAPSESAIVRTDSGPARVTVAAGSTHAPSSGTAAGQPLPPPAKHGSRDSTAAPPVTVPGLSPTAAPPGNASGTSGQVDEFLSYDRNERVAELRLIAGLDGSNGSLNFNGASRGARGITVPLGWRVRLATENDDGELSHSVVVIDDLSTIPVELPMPAFAGAATADATEGLAMGESETLSFVASRPGRYLIVCGVPGHGQGGQWMRLTVSPTATYPTNTP